VSGSWAVTSEDEWYNATYHQHAVQGGDSDDYWLYPTSSNSVHTTAQVNFNNVIGNTTPVGSYAANYYGTFDMGGNVWEWNGTILVDDYSLPRGASFEPGDYSLFLQADYRDGSLRPADEYLSAGFRVVLVPGSSSVALLAIGGLWALRRRR
jgi:formylglycine-generating enzyme required for sulfatase activity